MNYSYIRRMLLGAAILFPAAVFAQFPSDYAGTPFKGPHNVPGTLEAEDFDEGGEGISWHDATLTNQGSDYRPDCNVDIERQYSIGFTENGEWLNYTIEVLQDGTYSVRTYCCGPNGNGSFHLEVDNKTVTRALAAPVVGDWGDFSQYAEAEIQLRAGKHLFRWYTYGGMNLDRFVFDRVGDYTGVGEAGNFDYPITKPSSNPLFVNFDSPMYGSNGIGTMYTADPSAHVWNIDGKDVLYVYASHDMEPAQGCDRMDRYHVFSTEDMVNWTDHGEILSSADVPWGRPEGGFMWAPDCAYKDGIYYFYFPHPSDTDWGSSWKIGVATSMSPASGFTVQGYIEGAPTHIDPCVFLDDDGQAYVYNGGGNHCFGGKLKANMMELDGPMTEMEGLVDFHEGTWIHKYNGKYYLSYADNHGMDGNQLRYAVSDTPLGPWESRDAYLYATGCDTSHGSIVQFKGEWYAFYHTSNHSGVGQLRSVCVDKLEYDANGNILPVRNWGTPSSERGIHTVDGQELTIEARHFNDGGHHSAHFLKSGEVPAVSQENGRSFIPALDRGEWVRYSVDVTQADRYDLKFNVRPVANDTRFHMSINGTDRTGTLSPSGSGSWQEMKVENVRIPADAEYIDLRVDNGKLDFQNIVVTPAAPYKGSRYSDNIKVPGIIEAEDFDRGGEGVAFYNGTTGNQGNYTAYRDDQEGKKVDMEQSNDQNSANHHIRQQYIALNWMNTTKWFNYSAQCDEEGYYDAKAMVANQDGAGGTMQLTVGDHTYISNEYKGEGWTHCNLVEFPQKVYFSKGTNVIEMRSPMNVDYMEFTKSSTPTAVESVVAEAAPVIRAVSGGVSITGTDAAVDVFSISGVHVASYNVNPGHVALSSGLYIVKCGSRAVKLRVK